MRGRRSQSTSYNLAARRDRAFTHRIYLLGHNVSGEAQDQFHFSIQGTTGTTYTVSLLLNPERLNDNSEEEVAAGRHSAINCDCQDFIIRGAYCKHCLFVLLRVLHVPFEQLEKNIHEALNQQRNGGPLSSDRPIISTLDNVTMNALLDFLACSEHDPESLVAPELAPPPEGHRGDAVGPKKKPKLQGDQGDAADNRKIVEQRPIAPGDECAICFEELVVGMGKEEICYCQYGCGQSLHQDCLNRWANKKENVTCVYCRTAWFCHF